MKILPFHSQYIFSLLINIVDNRHLFIPNQEIYNINTRSNLKFHTPSFKVTKFQKGVNYSGIKHFNYLPSHLRSLFDDNKTLQNNYNKVSL